MRKTILGILGVLIIIAAYFGMKAIVASKTNKRPKPQKVVKTVFAQEVQNGTVPIVVPANGNLVAQRRVELFSEVQGVFEARRKRFRTGQPYAKGETLVGIQAAEYYATVQSSKSDLFNLLTSIMPDLKLDYPEMHTKWQTYLDGFDMEKTTPELPAMDSSKEKFFISGRGVFTSYYRVKNLEQRLAKYTIRAPFNGILTEALVTEGTLIRQGQKLGEFIDTSAYELEVAISKTYGDLLRVGETVSLTNLDKTKTYEGKVIRVNGSVDQATQTIKAYISVSHPDLKEGMYLEARLNAKAESDAIEVNRSLLMENDQVFVVRDTILDLIDVDPVFFSDKTVVLKNVPNGSLLVSKPVSGAYAGMLVKVFDGGAKTPATK
ncbi:efflux RND transporter periplasmic adaptor subunit [Sediminicola luteus]|uniref:Efflux transporter periplasmic adaptor subunit n=1 Tax=Sediminicola luteus TaxID=319238 RepID=A0A2A4GDJ8_9FLAO|nr:HlyD family efflux transporter periplasmic adaptor subunit [Sediminicola luteus]PCE65832.1 efflux transporter periplasmic adaptor subunit [Sediminicola luteus]